MTARRSKPLYAGEWFIVAPYRSSWWVPGTDGHCEICNRLTLAPVWYSMLRGVVRCQRCFDPRVKVES